MSQTVWLRGECAWCRVCKREGVRSERRGRARRALVGCWMREKGEVFFNGVDGRERGGGGVVRWNEGR